MDFELERALALSRSELELQEQASLLTETRKQCTSHNDLEFQNALELSKREASGSLVSNDGELGEGNTEFIANRSNSYENDLAKAIQLSLHCHQSKSPTAIVDLSEGAMLAKRKREDNSNNNELAEKRRLAAEAAMARLNN